jgi:hypothetical protein
MGKSGNIKIIIIVAAIILVIASAIIFFQKLISSQPYKWDNQFHDQNKTNEENLTADMNLSDQSAGFRAIGPGGCKTQTECQNFCQSNQQVCMQYCQQHSGEEFCSENKNQEPMSQNTMPCKTKEECDVYCKENQGACATEENKTITTKVSMPFSINDYSPVYWGLWPFCVHGGDHPEGHGGIDFELKTGTKIYASAEGTADFVQIDAGYGEGGGIAITTDNFAIAYYGIDNIQAKQGDHVNKGQYIGDAFKLSRGESFIHFEINSFVQQKLLCPTDYLDSDFNSSLSQMFSKAHYPEQAQEPNLCNCQNLPYKSNMLGKS